MSSRTHDIPKSFFSSMLHLLMTGRVRAGVKWKKVVMRFVALILWIAVIYVNSTLASLWPLPGPFQEFFFNESYVHIRWAGYFCSIFALGLIIGWWKILLSFLYFVFFPFVILFLLTGAFFKSWSIWQFLTSLKFLIFSSVLLPVSFTGILTSSSVNVTLVFMIVVAGLSSSFLLSFFKWVLQPLKFVNQIVPKAVGWWNKQADGILAKIDFSKDRESLKKDWELLKFKTRLESSETATLWLGRNMNVIFNERLVVVPFIFAFLFFFVFLTLIWASEFFGLEKIKPGSFHGIGPGSFWEFLYFSLTTITTSSFGDISPVTGTAKALVSLEIISGVILITLLVLAFSLASGSSVELTKERLRNLLKAQESKNHEWRTAIERESGDVIELTGTEPAASSLSPPSPLSGDQDSLGGKNAG